MNIFVIWFIVFSLFTYIVIYSYISCTITIRTSSLISTLYIHIVFIISIVLSLYYTMQCFYSILVFYSIYICYSLSVNTTSYGHDNVTGRIFIRNITSIFDFTLSIISTYVRQITLWFRYLVNLLIVIVGMTIHSIPWVIHIVLQFFDFGNILVQSYLLFILSFIYEQDNIL